MPNLLVMSFEGDLAPSFDLRCLHPGRKPPDGWGLGYYPGGEPAAQVLKEPAPPAGSIRSELVRAWEHLEASIFMLHIRTATWGQISGANTQPFNLAFRRRDWMFAHSGSLRDRLTPPPNARFEPVGSTDTELIFCSLMSWIDQNDAGWKTLADVDPEELRGWLEGMNLHGSMTCALTDGRDLCVYVDKNQGGAAYLAELKPPYESVNFSDDDLEVDLAKRGVKSRRGILVCSNPLQPESGVTLTWRLLLPGQLVIIRQGQIRRELLPPGAADMPSRPPRAASISTKQYELPRPSIAPVQRFSILHKTVYAYAKDVERSTHLLRLVPVHDRRQTLIESRITLSVEGQARDYEDVFGNYARRVLIETPYRELAIEARSIVEVLDTDPLSYRPIRARSLIPLVWMPWQRHMLQPFLLPPELPESELAELTDYAMSFVERNDYDLLDTLLDINSTIFKEYEYRQGSTFLSTTPFEVYVNRRGVCQDFTNLFICLVRLLGVPARYTCGYLLVSPDTANQRQAQASHAWVQVYLPEVGWRGFDPTNGVITQTNHVRVAVGRNYVDATPTSGTIYVGGGPETLTVEVRVEVVPIPGQGT